MIQPQKVQYNGCFQALEFNIFQLDYLKHLIKLNFFHIRFQEQDPLTTFHISHVFKDKE